MKSYEQKYKEALGWMKSLYGGLHGKTKEEAEKYFPELAESEDEKIRKAIIATIHLYYGEPLEDEAKDMITWLEKQGGKPQGKTALEAIMEEKSPTESLGISPEKYED